MPSDTVGMPLWLLNEGSIFSALSALGIKYNAFIIQVRPSVHANFSIKTAINALIFLHFCLYLF